MHRGAILLAFVLATPLVGHAKPPTTEGYARSAELRARIQSKARDIKREEEFRSKSLQEKYLIRFSQRAQSFEGFKLTGENVVRAVLEDWAAVQRPMKEVDAEFLKVLEWFPEVIRRRYLGIKFDKRERFKTSRPLVDALASDHYHIRKAAIEALKRVYRNEGLFYQPDLPANERRDKQRDWLRYIKRQR